MPHDLNQMLSMFEQDDYAVRLSTGVASILPFAEAVPYQPSVAAAAQAAMPEHADRVVAKVQELAKGQAAQSALGTANLLDKGDRGIALYSGVRSVYKAVKGTGDALETDPQQVADAALKALGVSWMAWRLYPGTAKDKAERLFQSRAGQSLIAFYVAMDVALPFSDNVLSSGGAFFSEMVDKAAVENAPRMAMVGDSGKALEFLGTIKDKLGDLTATAAQHIQPLTDMARRRMPKVMDGADSVAGVVATAADTLNVYRYLGAQMVLEQLVSEATAAVRVELDAEEAARLEAERQAREEAAARLAASAVKKDYTLDEGQAAASLANKPVKYTRTADKPVEKKGCGFCMMPLVILPPLVLAASWGLARAAELLLQ